MSLGTYIQQLTKLTSLDSQEGMKYTFQETVKLLAVLVTAPMLTSKAERCSSMLKRLKTFQWKKERLCALGMLTAEKVFFNNIKEFSLVSLTSTT